MRLKRFNDPAQKMRFNSQTFPTLTFGPLSRNLGFKRVFLLLTDQHVNNRPFSKMAAENLNKSKLKTNTSTRKSTLTLVNLPSLSISGEITAEKMYVENWKIYRRLYDWGYNAYPQSYKRPGTWRLLNGLRSKTNRLDVYLCELHLQMNKSIFSTC